MNATNQTTKTHTNRTNKINTKDLVVTAMFTAIICVMSQISIPTAPIPFTLGIFAIFLTGALLTPRYAFLAVLTYLLLGVFGAPVFANFKGGIQNLVGMTGGYLMAYPLIALITSLFYQLTKKYKLLSLTFGMVLSLLVCYLIGTAWFSILTGYTFYKSLTLCVFPFVIFDLIKIILAVAISTVIRKVIFRNMQF